MIFVYKGLKVIHLRKLSVGTTNVYEQQAWQQMRLDQTGEVFHITRNWPKRAEELLEGGYIYWIIKGFYNSKQKIIGFKEEFYLDEDGNAPPKPYCKIILGHSLIAVKPWPHRPFQGWRYLEEKDAPPDLNGSETDPDADQLLNELEYFGIGLLPNKK